MSRAAPVGPLPDDERSLRPQNIDEVQAAKFDIRILITEIERLCQGEGPLNEFFEGLLNRVVSASGAVAGAIWQPGEGGRLNLAYQVNLPATGLIDDREKQIKHALLLKRASEQREPQLVLPHTGADAGLVERASESNQQGEAGNPTPWLVVIAPITVDRDTQAVIEIFQRPEGGPTTQRGYLRFLLSMAEHAGGWFRNRQLRMLRERQGLWDKLDDFLKSLHRNRTIREVAYAIANDGRRVVDCDRVSVALTRGSRAHIESISGLDSVERRAEEVARMADLVAAVLRTGEPLWWEGVGKELPPQIEDPLQHYVDASHARALGVIPLFEAEEPNDAPANSSGETPRRPKRKKPCGALVCEQLRESDARDDLKARAQTVADHAGPALAHAVAYEGIFLLPLWRSLGQVFNLLRWETLPWTLSVVGALAAAMLALWLVPGDFDLACRGKLVPATQRDIFAPLDGAVVDVAVRHGDSIRAGQMLARLKNTELEIKISDLLGKQEVGQARLRGIERQLREYERPGSKPNAAELGRLSSERLELEKELETAERELQYQKAREAQLDVKAEADGEVMTWQVEQRLNGRPVRMGQSLMTLADTAGPWEVRLFLPEKRLAHLDTAMAATRQDSPVEVAFMLSTHPGREFVGHVVEVERTAEVHEDQGNTLLVRVAIDKSVLPELRSDTTVQAKVHCGQRSIGYVWFCDLIETVQTRLLFWL